MSGGGDHPAKEIRLTVLALYGDRPPAAGDPLNRRRPHWNTRRSNPLEAQFASSKACGDDGFERTAGNEDAPSGGELEGVRLPSPLRRHARHPWTSEECPLLYLDWS